MTARQPWSKWLFLALLCAVGLFVIVAFGHSGL